MQPSVETHTHKEMLNGIGVSLSSVCVVRPLVVRL